MKIWVVLMAMSISSCSVMQNNSFISRAEKLIGDTAHVYALPYEKGKSYMVMQGYESLFSHKDDYAIDFKMKPGTKVLAAREGVVWFVRDSVIAGGVGKKYVGQANGITVKHADGTYGHYWHLMPKGSLVKVGDTVSRGQWIGLSGSTGFSAFPHLHFEVTKQPQISNEDFPVLFETDKGIKFLQPLRRYKAL